ncbi:hypothetical protein OQA88_9439 [Cercophora sp. LCS_1]
MASRLAVTQGNVRFIVELDRYESEKPYYLAGPLNPSDEHRRTNAVFETKAVQFRDLRGNENLFSLKSNGFQYMIDEKADADQLSVLNEDRIKEYAEDTLSLMRKLFNTESCFISGAATTFIAFPVSRLGIETSQMNRRHKLTSVNTSPKIGALYHTLDGGLRRIRRHLSGREQKILLDDPVKNTWRPLNGTVMDYPLAVCDPTTINISKDATATDRVSPIYQGENYYLKYRDAHHWYWLSEQRVEELLVFVSFDSARDMSRSCKI